MYTFSIEKGYTPLVKVTVVNDIIEKDAYFKSLIEKCFERVFQMIKDKEDKKEEIDSEQDIESDD